MYLQVLIFMISVVLADNIKTFWNFNFKLGRLSNVEAFLIELMKTASIAKMGCQMTRWLLHYFRYIYTSLAQCYRSSAVEDVLAYRASDLFLLSIMTLSKWFPFSCCQATALLPQWRLIGVCVCERYVCKVVCFSITLSSCSRNYLFFYLLKDLASPSSY